MIGESLTNTCEDCRCEIPHGLLRCETCFKGYLKGKKSPTDALAVQEGGGHYKDLKIQPVEFIHANDLGFMEGCVVKYVSRYKRKNGLEDLKKARHFIDLLIQLEYPEG